MGILDSHATMLAFATKDMAAAATTALALIASPYASTTKGVALLEILDALPGGTKAIALSGSDFS